MLRQDDAVCAERWRALMRSSIRMISMACEGNNILSLRVDIKPGQEKTHHHGDRMAEEALVKITDQLIRQKWEKAAQQNFTAEFEEKK